MSKVIQVSWRDQPPKSWSQGVLVVELSTNGNKKVSRVVLASDYHPRMGAPHRLFCYRNEYGDPHAALGSCLFALTSQDIASLFYDMACANMILGCDFSQDNPKLQGMLAEAYRRGMADAVVQQSRLAEKAEGGER